MATKIYKIAKDLNIGIGTAVEFLRKHNIEVNGGGPNARIGHNAVDLLYKEYCKVRTVKGKTDQHSTEYYGNLLEKIKTVYTSYSNSDSEAATKTRVIREFDNLRKYHRKAIDSISSAKAKHDTMSSIQKSFLDELKSILSEIEINIDELREEIVWDHLVVGFFGETNAGKSTTIETLRLRYGKGKRNWVHGAIVGNGQRDFTKDASEYDLNLNGKRITLIDIPGIEGDESKYAMIIKKALRRAHYVFYVHCKRQQPDEKIVSRIKEYLSDWTHVYSIMNVSGSPSNYEEPEDRETLITSQVEKQNAVIQDAFRKALGDLYQRNIPLQALIALASCSDFPENQNLNSASKKLKKYFGNTKTAYQFSNMDELVKVLEDSCEEFEEIIANSQMQKVQAIKIKSLKKLAEFETSNTNQINQLKKRLESLRSDISNEFNSVQSRLKMGLGSIVERQFTALLIDCNSIIDNNKDSQKVKSKVIDKVRALPYKLDSELNKKTKDIEKNLHDYLYKRFTEFKDVDIAVPNHDFHLCISTEIDIDYVVEKLNVSFEDVLDVAGTTAGGAAAGAGIGSFFPVIGTIVGAAVGAGVGLIAGVALGDDRKAKAKQAINDEISVCRSETKNFLNGIMLKISKELVKMKSELVKQIQTEITNIESLQKERLNLFNLLRK